MKTRNAIFVFVLATVASLAGAVNLAIWPVIHCLRVVPRWQIWIHNYSVENSNLDVCIISIGYDVILVLFLSTSACLRRSRKLMITVKVSLSILTPLFQVRAQPVVSTFSLCSDFVILVNWAAR
jgi:hypothetical protein